tara:strand:+ start:5730 stop:7418 length:1689 start_codon:yes stop_codon:yes gene_type:complete
MRASEFKSCPRTKEKSCQCESLNTISEAEEIVKAVVQLEHVEGDISGGIVLKQEPNKPTIIRGQIKGLKPGKHGIHIHEFGDLSDGCDSAGGHYNPDGVDHGDLMQGHVGDLGNIVADEQGIARFKIVARRVDLSGDRSVVGRAMVIHADEDDLGLGGDEESLKTGNAGERLACGVIRLRKGIEESYNRGVSDKHFDRNQLPQIRRKHLDKSDLKYKEGTISIDKIKPVQSQRVDGLSKKAEDVFLKKVDRPFILDRRGYLINGHHRYDAANILGIKRVPAIIVDADIEKVMDVFKDKTSDRAVMQENYFKDLLKSKMSEAEVINFPGTYVKREYVNINGVKMLKDVWDYMSQDREEEHGFDDNMNTVKKKISNFTGNEDPRILKKAYQVELRNFIDEFENQDMDPQPFIDELEQLDERNLNPAVKDYVKGKKTKLIKVKVADLDDEAHDDRFSRVIDVDPDVGVDLDEPILLDVDGKTILDGFHRVYQAKRVGRDVIPAEIIENFADGKKKGKSRPGRVKRAGASCKGSVTSLRKKAKDSSGEKSKMYHWCANMKSGRKKK